MDLLCCRKIGTTYRVVSSADMKCCLWKRLVLNICLWKSVNEPPHSAQLSRIVSTEDSNIYLDRLYFRLYACEATLISWLHPGHRVKSQWQPQLIWGVSKQFGHLAYYVSYIHQNYEVFSPRELFEISPTEETLSNKYATGWYLTLHIKLPSNLFQVCRERRF